MSRILGLSGRKQSGKNTVCNFLHGMEMLSTGAITDFKFNNKGKLIVPASLVDGEGKEQIEYGIFDLEREKTDSAFFDYMANNIWPFIKAYSFADMLKMNVCMDVLGLSYEQCYGTDADKNTKTHISWDNILGSENKGNMTAREVMQFVGTDFFRGLYPDVWADSTIRRVQTEGSAFAIITDCRFPNEVEAIQKAGGKVIRLTRNGDGPDAHLSETALDKENFDWNKFDAVIDNSDVDIRVSNEVVYEKLLGWKWVEMEYESK